MGWKSFSGVVVASGVLAVVTVTASGSLAMPGSGCAQFKALKGVFPKASAVGLTAQTRVIRGEVRSPIWPGTCDKWFTSYRRGSVKAEVSLTLYRTHKQALVALAEPAYGHEVRLPSGALVRVLAGMAGVDGAMTPTAGVASVYRNVFVSSLSIDAEPIGIAAQTRLHRSIHAGVLALR